jgi:Las17-binding protein actin regulator
MRAEILSYSRSRGLFAGVSLEGTTLRPDDDASELVYGHAVTAKEIVRGEKTHVPAAGRHCVDVLEKSAPHNESKEAASMKQLGYQLADSYPGELSSSEEILGSTFLLLRRNPFTLCALLNSFLFMTSI